MRPDNQIAHPSEEMKDDIHLVSTWLPLVMWDSTWAELG